MGTKIKDAPDAAGVECPKKTGKMGKDESCRECDNWIRCWNRIMQGVMP